MSVQGKVLVLGAGLVTKPLVHYLSKHNFHVIVANRTLQNAEELIKGKAGSLIQIILVHKYQGVLSINIAFMKL
jgi:glutamyl-tRNA reductase